MRVLVSGASVAGPVVAYWLSRYGFTVTVVERAPGLRKAGGHAVDLFRPAMDIAERMGVLGRIESKQTGTDVVSIYREGHDRRSYDIPMGRFMSAISDRHVEIMRDDLAEILYSGCDGVEYLFGDTITGLDEHSTGVEVTFAHGPSRRFDLVIGADGLHSTVRRLTFGPESVFASWIGAYLAVASVPNYLELSARTVVTNGANRIAGIYGAPDADDARAIFLFRPPRQLEYHHQDTMRQKEILREQFDGMGARVTRLLDETDRAQTFYFDSITQLCMDSWSQGRVTLAGDAGYCPGPAVGGSTSLAVVGAYVLAGELALAGGDHRRAFVEYERAMSDYVVRSRAFAVGAAKRLVPRSGVGAWGMIAAGAALTRLPGAATRLLLKLTPATVRLHDSVRVKDYPALVG